MSKKCEECTIRKFTCGCILSGSNIPSEWKIKKPRRFTDTDILWAKAAKASGAKEIQRDDGSAYAYTDSIHTTFATAFFPDSAFQSLKKWEAVQIDDILEEEKEMEW